MKLYHGTNQENYDSIIECGYIESPVFLTPRRDIADGYGDLVVEVDVEVDKLLIDLDFPCLSLLTVQEANEYLDKEWRIDDYLDAGYSVGLNHDIRI